MALTNRKPQEEPQPDRSQRPRYQEQPSVEHVALLVELTQLFEVIEDIPSVHILVERIDIDTTVDQAINILDAIVKRTPREEIAQALAIKQVENLLNSIDPAALLWHLLARRETRRAVTPRNQRPAEDDDAPAPEPAPAA